MLSLTQEERKVILFLIIVALIGIGINFLQKRYSEVKVIGSLSQDIAKTNLNKADKEMLLGVCGIGDKLAQRIIEYRQNYGDFKDIRELKNINGIGESKYEAIKDYFSVE